MITKCRLVTSLALVALAGLCEVLAHPQLQLRRVSAIAAKPGRAKSRAYEADMIST
jgi:hypothetical protein